ncbi:hypothetical protein NPIL_417771 [Nephila pilipes]|uniref:Uncharacterized protein n=1 Tax=Nephila pilipes TaxID=299642 RepID=A0A8X6N8C6_NEPPI|nr:hypothetical protein NPIL_417771 [Nephila pilipes]
MPFCVPQRQRNSPPRPVTIRKVTGCYVNQRVWPKAKCTPHDGLTSSPIPCLIVCGQHSGMTKLYSPSQPSVKTFIAVLPTSTQEKAMESV